MDWLAPILVPLMLLALVPLLASGVPVVLALIACGLLFGGLGVALGLVPLALVTALPLRLEFIIGSESLLAIPFFTFMGVVLQRTGVAEDLLEVAGQVFGPIRGGLAIAAILVGALLAAATGVVAASVISLALISFPAMLRFGYEPRVAAGVVAATGTLTQVVPPSLVLIIVAQQLNMSLGDVYAGVLMPAALLIGLYIAWIGCLAVLWPAAVPRAAVAQEGGSTGRRSLAALALAGTAAAAISMRGYPLLLATSGRTAEATADEWVIVSIGAALSSMVLFAALERWLGLRWLSPLARRVAMVLLPPLMLLFAVLGSVFLGAATPNESGSLGALAALAIAIARRRLTAANLMLALQDTVRLTCVVMILLFGATVFSLAFHALEGARWVERALGSLPGGPTGFLVVAMASVFVLGMFLDFFELAIILLPILGPVADQMGIDKVWFAVLMGLNLQTAYLTPPFGFALFYLRSVVPVADEAGAPGEPVRRGIDTLQIYRGVLPFIAIQVIVMALVVAYPVLALGLVKKPVLLDAAQTERRILEMSPVRAPGRLEPATLPLESQR